MDKDASELGQKIQKQQKPKAKKTSKRKSKPKRTFPQHSIEECKVIADKIKN